MGKFQEGDGALLHVKVSRANDEQALISFVHLCEEGLMPYSLRVPISELESLAEVMFRG